ncbi:MAG: hypothetical protein JRJ66_15855 [Deltaproteobacteria bacterium]|nr:hypothetical protein [Deltaproteobacteria bacterium]
MKFKKMQDIYLKRNHEHYSQDQILQINHRFNALLHKGMLTSLHLEQLWAMSEYFRSDLLYEFNNLPQEVSWNDTHIIIGNMFLESFLYQARSLLDFYQSYICVLLGTKTPRYMSRKKFSRAMKKSPKHFGEKPLIINEYFDEKVFIEGAWGNILKSLRDKITHKDIIKQSYEGTEKYMQKVLLNWPTIQGKTYERLCQEIENGYFGMIVETSEILFDLEWKPGMVNYVNWEEN